jgi:hypothetical protein
MVLVVVGKGVLDSSRARRTLLVSDFVMDRSGRLVQYLTNVWLYACRPKIFERLRNLKTGCDNRADRRTEHGARGRTREHTGTRWDLNGYKNQIILRINLKDSTPI